MKYSTMNTEMYRSIVLDEKNAKANVVRAYVSVSVRRYLSWILTRFSPALLTLQ